VCWNRCGNEFYGMKGAKTACLKLKDDFLVALIFVLFMLTRGSLTEALQAFGIVARAFRAGPRTAFTSRGVPRTARVFRAGPGTAHVFRTGPRTAHVF